MLTDSRPAGRSTSAKPQAAATIPPPTVNASRTTGRAGSIITTPEAGPVYKMGGTSRIAIREPRRAPANQAGAGRLRHLPPRRSSVPPGDPCRPPPVPPLDPRSDPMRSPLSPPVVVVVALAAAPLAAQETPTEKPAAADVIRRMNELERSLALPRLVARLTEARDARRDAVVARAKELMDKELLAMADDITRHPETGWKEERSVKILTDYPTAHGFDVEPGVAGLKTAFVARYRRGTPGPTLL